ncbi:hypothetical protein DUNSADRAFT_11212 [Dunaliella salina]|uniref:Secreted protein n=1 Tax=Dunaliella salina TaxID=3046 RepID=A0ABQ7GDW5_DUNSA|nr:hypothetical protein DUNSADRAFT_11212 [Dunaliella salina]|eukprot:KAF5832803.1 hypothetical protein DUNSADRAFT_11212 [Dunaliella salina]
MLNPIVLLLLPAAYIFASVVALLQFQVLFQLLQVGITKLHSVSALAFAKPVTGVFMDHLVRVFGRPDKFVPQPTHVLLVALILAVVVHLERARR